MISQHFLKNLQFDCQTSGVYTFHVAHHFNNRCCFAMVLHSNKLFCDPQNSLEIDLYCLGVCFVSLVSDSLSFDFRQKVSGITGSRNKTPKKYLPQNYLQEVLWKTINQDDVCHPRKQFFRCFNHRYSLHRCAKTPSSENIFLRYY